MAALVDQDASTAGTEGTHESFYNRTTEEAAHKIILEYKHELRAQISSHFPLRTIEKSVGEDYILGRGKGSDVLLNDERMSRTYAEIATKPGGDEGVRFFLKNCTKNKSVILESYQKKPLTLKAGMEAELRDRSSFKLMDVEFRVTVNYGCVDSSEVELEVKCCGGTGKACCQESVGVPGSGPMPWPCEQCPQNQCQRGVDCSDDQKPQLYTNPTTTVRLDAPTSPVAADGDAGGRHERHGHKVSNDDLMNPLSWEQFPRGPALRSPGDSSPFNSGFPAMRLQSPGTGDPEVLMSTDRSPTEHEEEEK
ncbi:uncharacterized protein LOC124133990 [Haliotis rufescens]|uniref:uncharacterized protein LOC124133990 n=1 Tax=Haliotis rufescens TaxID=6454 RepID=UPI00201EB255|nr:uncharacterized protein LOC124133990 [Haliotis rufescens]XP_046354558.2 uncharacterized protein LOC124133990 [Haliotis rufescens]